MKLVKHSKAKTGPLAPVSRAASPYWPLRRLQDEIDRLFEEPFGGWLAPTPDVLEAWGPAVDVDEDKDNVFVRAELPGMKKEEIGVSMIGEMLNITGERKEETEFKGAKSYRKERYFGRFHRSILLPAAVEAAKIEAHYKDGILTVTCPKTEEAKRKQVDIKID
jgi:HSP20 family protein